MAAKKPAGKAAKKAAPLSRTTIRKGDYVVMRGDTENPPTVFVVKSIGTVKNQHTGKPVRNATMAIEGYSSEHHIAVSRLRRVRKPRQPKAEAVTIEDLARDANRAGCTVRVAFDAAPTEPQHVVLPPAPVNPDTVWIVGRNCGENQWDFQGVFRTETEAVAACVDHTWFVGPAVLGFALPAETVPWPGLYYPKATEPAEVGVMITADGERPASVIDAALAKLRCMAPAPAPASQSEQVARLIRKHGADWHRHVGRRSRLHLWPITALCIVVLAAIGLKVAGVIP